jgi:hypothetical protein
MQIVKESGIHWRVRVLIRKLYTDQSVKVRLDQVETRNVKLEEKLDKNVDVTDFIQLIQRIAYQRQMTLCHWLRKKWCYRA